MEKKVDKIYKDANKEISKDWIAFMDSHAPKLQDAYDALQEAIKSGDKDAINEAKDVYQRTAMNITVNNERFKGMADETAAKISHTNEVALAYINDQVPSIYTMNYNAFKNENIKGYSFSLVNEQAVKNLAKTDKLLLPTKKLDIPKDMRWNKKMINSQMVQGILQGESVPKLAERLFNVTDMDRVSAIRNARTITTAAENKGRQDSFKKAQDDGVIMMREWVAAHDDHTRAWHLELHGVQVGVDEPFENEYGQIMYPADPSADPANVYNCRCAVRAVVKGFRWNDNLEEEAEAETAKIEANEKVLVARDYDTDFAKYYGGDYYDSLVDLVDACDNDDLKLVWEQYQTQIGAKDPNYNGRAYASMNNIHVSKAKEVSGSSWRNPYEVTFHESGHAIDFITKDLADTNGMKLMYSSAYKDGLYPATIRDEVKELVNAKDAELKAAFKAHMGDYEWMTKNGFLSDYSYDFYKATGSFIGGEPKYSKAYAYKAVEKEIRSIAGGGKAISDLSDMLEGATSAQIRCGYGHGKSYWNKFLGIDEKLATEAFAEMTSATVANGESLETIKRYLPKSYGVYTDMLKDIASKGGK